MAESAEVWRIPGDGISITVEEFEHEQHLLNVYAIYVLESDTSIRLELLGSPEEKVRLRRETSNKVVYTSRVVVSQTIDEDMPVGRYWFQGFECYTYGGQRLRFAKPPESLSSYLSNPIVIHPEPTSSPQLILPYMDDAQE